MGATTLLLVFARNSAQAHAVSSGMIRAFRAAVSACTPSARRLSTKSLPVPGAAHVWRRHGLVAGATAFTVTAAAVAVGAGACCEPSDAASSPDASEHESSAPPAGKKRVSVAQKRALWVVGTVAGAVVVVVAPFLIVPWLPKKLYGGAWQ